MATTRPHARFASLLACRPLLYSPRVLLALIALLAVGLTLNGIHTSPDSFSNYTIYRLSFHHLRHGVGLYLPDPNHHFDLFKYSPTFALLMAPFWVLPRTPGLLIWNLLNALAPFWAVMRLNLDARGRAFVLLFSLVELQTSLHNAQSNGILAGLMIGAFAAFERRQVATAALLLCLGFYNKPFAAVPGLLFLFYPGKLRFLATAAIGGIGLGLLPAAFLGGDGLVATYREWMTLLANDHPHEANYSLMSLVRTFFHRRLPVIAYLGPGFGFLLLPMARRSLWGEPGYRLMVFAGMLVWLVIFNHKAESPTYLIAVLGAGLWALAEPRSRARTCLLTFVFVVTEAAATDLCPRGIRIAWVQPYGLKALPCVVLWLALTLRLTLSRRFAARLSDTGG